MAHRATHAPCTGWKRRAMRPFHITRPAVRPGARGAPRQQYRCHDRIHLGCKDLPGRATHGSLANASTPLNHTYARWAGVT